jgi:very-short-patch-repair endonuclease
MENNYRDLTPFEVRKAIRLEKTRTQYEMVAYRLLPKSMRKNVERNHPVAFVGTSAYFPDLLLRKEKICIEIDGRYHKNRYNEDRRRDEAFIKGGFIVIRIKNEDTRVNVAFWQRLLEGLEGYEVDREEIRPFIDELRKMIDDEIRSWTSLPEDN